MSEPIFRAWDNKTKQWIKDFCVKPDGDLLRVIFSNLTGNVLTVDLKDAVLCRSTGLRDSKRTKEFPEGEMIFEHDIVKRNGFIGEVIFEFSGWHIAKTKNCNVYEYPSFYSNANSFERIGSSLENPELLEKKQ